MVDVFVYFHPGATSAIMLVKSLSLLCGVPKKTDSMPLLIQLHPPQLNFLIMHGLKCLY